MKKDIFKRVTLAFIIYILLVISTKELKWLNEDKSLIV